MRRDLEADQPEWLERPERGSVLAMRFLVWLMLTLGRPLARALLHPICAYFVLFSPRARRASAARAMLALLSRPARASASTISASRDSKCA